VKENAGQQWDAVTTMVQRIDLTQVVFSAAIGSDETLRPVDGLNAKLRAIESQQGTHRVHTLVCAKAQQLGPEWDEYRQPGNRLRLIEAASLPEAMVRLQDRMREFREPRAFTDEGRLPAARDPVPRADLEGKLDAAIEFVSRQVCGESGGTGGYVFVTGAAGTGKTLLLADFVRRERRKGLDDRVVAVHFIRRGDAAREDPERFLRALAAQVRLSQGLVWPGHAPETALPAVGEFRASLRAAALARGTDVVAPMIVVIDGLDEALGGTARYPKDRLDEVLPDDTDLPPGVLLLVSTRSGERYLPSHSRERSFPLSPHEEVAIGGEPARQDVAAFVQHMDQLHALGLGETLRGELADRIGPSFALAEVLFQFARSRHPEDVTRWREDVELWRRDPERIPSTLEAFLNREWERLESSLRRPAGAAGGGLSPDDDALAGKALLGLLCSALRPLKKVELEAVLDALADPRPPRPRFGIERPTHLGRHDFRPWLTRARVDPLLTRMRSFLTEDRAQNLVEPASATYREFIEAKLQPLGWSADLHAVLGWGCLYWDVPGYAEPLGAYALAALPWHLDQAGRHRQAGAVLGRSSFRRARAEALVQFGGVPRPLDEQQDVPDWFLDAYVELKQHWEATGGWEGMPEAERRRGEAFIERVLREAFWLLELDEDDVIGGPHGVRVAPLHSMARAILGRVYAQAGAQLPTQAKSLRLAVLRRTLSRAQRDLQAGATISRGDTIAILGQEPEWYRIFSPRAWRALIVLLLVGLGFLSMALDRKFGWMHPEETVAAVALSDTPVFVNERYAWSLAEPNAWLAGGYTKRAVPGRMIQADEAVCLCIPRARLRFDYGGQLCGPLDRAFGRYVDLREFRIIEGGPVDFALTGEPGFWRDTTLDAVWDRYRSAPNAPVREVPTLLTLPMVVFSFGFNFLLVPLFGALFVFTIYAGFWRRTGTGSARWTRAVVKLFLLFLGVWAAVAVLGFLVRPNLADDELTLSLVVAYLLGHETAPLKWGIGAALFGFLLLLEKPIKRLFPPMRQPLDLRRAWTDSFVLVGALVTVWWLYEPVIMLPQADAVAAHAANHLAEQRAQILMLTQQDHGLFMRHYAERVGLQLASGGILIQTVLLFTAVYLRRRVSGAVFGLFFLGTTAAVGSYLVAVVSMGLLQEQAWLAVLLAVYLYLVLVFFLESRGTIRRFGWVRRTAWLLPAAVLIAMALWHG